MAQITKLQADMNMESPNSAGLSVLIPDAGNRIQLTDIREIETRSYAVIEQLREIAFSPDSKKALSRRFNVTEAASMAGRSTQAIAKAEKEGRLPQPDKNEKGRRMGYTLPQINTMRNLFGTLPWRDSDQDEAIVLAIQNFKGGVGKSTLTVNLAHYLGLKGYRICVIDCDPQASTTALFGLNPDFDLVIEDTLIPYFMGDEQTLNYALRDTYWDQMCLIPTNLSLNDLEYNLAARMPQNNRILDYLRHAVQSIAKDFDVILIDPPPALGMISLSVLRAANALLVPVRPATIDFGSTANFFTMLIGALESLERIGLKPNYKFLKVLVNDMNEGKSAHRLIVEWMKRCYETSMLSTVMKNSAEIDNASARLMSVYELTGPITSKEVYDRCLTYLDAMNQEIETLIRLTWPSHRAGLRKEGIV